jgi:hypothetical protein
MVVAADGRLELRTVTIGLESPERVEVRSGLRPGDEAVVGGRAKLKVGAAVTPSVTELQAISEGAK